MKNAHMGEGSAAPRVGSNVGSDFLSAYRGSVVGSTFRNGSGRVPRICDDSSWTTL